MCNIGLNCIVIFLIFIMWAIIDELWVMTYEWLVVMGDKGSPPWEKSCKVMDIFCTGGGGGWWGIIDEWLVMSDWWLWVMSYEWVMEMGDEWLVIIDEWLMVRGAYRKMFSVFLGILFQRGGGGGSIFL